MHLTLPQFLHKDFYPHNNVLTIIAPNTILLLFTGLKFYSGISKNLDKGIFYSDEKHIKSHIK